MKKESPASHHSPPFRHRTPPTDISHPHPHAPPMPPAVWLAPFPSLARGNEWRDKKRTNEVENESKTRPPRRRSAVAPSRRTSSHFGPFHTWVSAAAEPDSATAQPWLTCSHCDIATPSRTVVSATLPCSPSSQEEPCLHRRNPVFTGGTLSSQEEPCLHRRISSSSATSTKRLFTPPSQKVPVSSQADFVVIGDGLGDEHELVLQVGQQALALERVVVHVGLVPLQARLELRGGKAGGKGLRVRGWARRWTGAGRPPRPRCGPFHPRLCSPAPAADAARACPLVLLVGLRATRTTRPRPTIEGRSAGPQCRLTRAAFRRTHSQPAARARACCSRRRHVPAPRRHVPAPRRRSGAPPESRWLRWPLPPASRCLRVSAEGTDTT
eukprot:scaffold781_cov123-Isochrysis_galbana.AAC.7